MTNLDIVETVKKGFALFKNNIKSHIIVSYLFYIPVMLISLSVKVTSDALYNKETKQFIEGAGAVAFNSIMLILFFFSLLTFFYLFSFSRKVTMDEAVKTSTLIKRFVKYLLYFILFFLAEILALITIGVLVGLIVSVISAQIGSPVIRDVFSYITPFILMVALILILSKLILTFVAIARGNTKIPFRNSWFYTTGHVKELVAIISLSILPAFLLSSLISIILHQIGITSAQSIIADFILAPVYIAMVALPCASIVAIYEKLSLNFKSDL